MSEAVVPLRSFEDFVPGLELPLPFYTVTREEIVEFAAEFDPQPFHLDEEAAKATLLGGLSASGWHTCSMMMRMIVDGYLSRSSGQGSPGVEHVRWLRPVRPGDVLTGRSTVLEARLSASRPGLGIVRIETELATQAGEPVLNGVYSVILKTRGAAPAARPEDRGRSPESPMRRPDGFEQPLEAPRSSSFWETLEVGAEEELGRHLFTAADIVRFAEKYDPQIFHLDAEAARATMFGGLCASGWHTSAVMMRLIVESQTRRVGAWMKAGNAMPKLGPSPGAKALKWTRPVFAGDTIVYRQTIAAKRASQSRAGWGIVETGVEARNQDGAIVFSMRGAVLIGTD